MVAAEIRASPAVVAAKKELRTLADDPNTVDLYIGANGGFYASTRRAIKEAKRRLFHSRHKEHRRSRVPFSFMQPVLRTPPEGEEEEEEDDDDDDDEDDDDDDGGDEEVGWPNAKPWERALITQEKLKKCAYMAMVEEEIITWALRELRTKASCDPIASLAPSSQLTSSLPPPSSRCSRTRSPAASGRGSTSRGSTRARRR